MSWKSAVLTFLFVSYASASTIEIPIDTVIFEESDWSNQDLPIQMENLNRIYAQCGISFRHNTHKDLAAAEIGMEKFPNDICAYNVYGPTACEKAGFPFTTLEVAKTRKDQKQLTVYFIKRVVSASFFEDTDIVTSNPSVAVTFRQGRTEKELEKFLPEQTFTIWLDRSSQELSQKDMVLGHEVAHALTNASHNYWEEANILNNNPASRKEILTTVQCEDARKIAITVGGQLTE